MCTFAPIFSKAPSKHPMNRQAHLYDTATLANGLRIIRQTSPTDVVYAGYAIDAGTRDEAADEFGLAHFVEHMLFKGTVKRRPWHILNRMENVGGDLNACTGKEETMVYTASLRKDFSRALELLTDIVFHSTFPQREVSREVEVILDELESYEDTPSDLIFDDFEDVLFEGHALGHNILGTPRQLRKFTGATALSFTQRYYHPSNAVLFVFGNISMKRIVHIAEQLTRDLEPGTPNLGRTAPPPYQPRNVVKQRHTHQLHVLTGCVTYPAGDNRRTGLYLLNNLLGGPGMNSRLNVALREQTGLVYNIESNLTGYTDTGIFNIYFGCDANDLDRCLSLMQKELDLLCDKPLTSLQLSAAKKQLIGQMGVAGDNFENNALAMAKSYLHYGLCEDHTTVCQRIEALTADELQRIACELFRKENLTTLIYR